jgi:osmotically-inducible protein OsmY
MSFKKLMVVAALAAASLCAQGTPADDRIYDQVRLKLAGDRDVKGGGIVTLQGKVQKDRQKSRAERLTKKVKGVTSVVNNLRVELP